VRVNLSRVQTAVPVVETNPVSPSLRVSKTVPMTIDVSEVDDDEDS